VDARSVDECAGFEPSVGRPPSARAELRLTVRASGTVPHWRRERASGANVTHPEVQPVPFVPIPRRASATIVGDTRQACEHAISASDAIGILPDRVPSFLLIRSSTTALAWAYVPPTWTGVDRDTLFVAILYLRRGVPASSRRPPRRREAIHPVADDHPRRRQIGGAGGRVDIHRQAVLELVRPRFDDLPPPAVGAVARLFRRRVREGTTTSSRTFSFVRAASPSGNRSWIVVSTPTRSSNAVIDANRPWASRKYSRRSPSAMSSRLLSRASTDRQPDTGGRGSRGNRGRPGR